MAESPISPKSAEQPTPFAAGAVASHPVRFGAACGIGYWLFASLFIFSGHLDLGALIWLGLIAVAAGIAGWTVALGRRTATPVLVLVGLVVMVMPAATREIPRLADLLQRLGLGAERGSWWRWVDTGETGATMLVTPGVLASLLLAAACAVISSHVHKLPTRPAPPIHPLIPAAGAASMPIVLTIGSSYDPGFYPFLAGYAALVGMGAAAVTIGAHRRRTRLVIGGWTTAAALPVFHGLGIVTPLRDQWAPTMVHDLAGVLVTLIAAAATMVGLLRVWVAEQRPPSHTANHHRTVVALCFAFVLVAVLPSCADGIDEGMTASPLSPTTTTRAVPTTSDTPTTTEMIPTVDIPPLLVAHGGGIDLWTPEASIPLLTGMSVAVAAPDLHGGVVFQETQDHFGRAMPIMRMATKGSAPEVLIEGDESIMMTLVQVTQIDQTPTVVYRRWVELPNDCAAEDQECRWAYHEENLMTRDLLGGLERNLGRIGSFESDLLAFDFGENRAGFSINRYEGGACAGWVQLGAIAEESSNGWIGEGSALEGECVAGPTPWCRAGERCDGVARAAASPDGTLIAYAFSEWRPETGEHFAPTVVIQDAATGADLLHAEVGGAGVQPVWLDFDGRFIILGRTDIRLPGEDQQIDPLLIDLAGRAVPIPITGRATFWSGADPATAPPTADAAHNLPIDDDWTVSDLAWPIQPSCCDAPALGPASPPGRIPSGGAMPQDGLYDITVARVWDPPALLNVSIRRWVSCTERPDACPADPPDNGVFADPLTEVATNLELNSDLTVVIQPLQTWQDGRFPNPPRVITGSGSAFYELLAGWCSGYLPERNPENCGIDHAFLDWVWSPHQGGQSIDQIIADLESSDSGPDFPFTQFDDRATDSPCSTDRRCVTAYRGPRGTHLIADFTLLEMGEDWPAHLYGWWTSLEVRDGKPILHIDAGRLAG